MGVGGSIWQDYWNTLPYYPATLPDPDKIPYAFGAGVGGLHVSSNRDISGYDDARVCVEQLHWNISLSQ